MPIELDEAFWERCWTHRRGLRDELKCTILAAGLGKRLEPLTQSHLPKPLFPLGAKLPLLEIWVRKLVGAGLTDISMNLCVLPKTITTHFGDGDRFCADITYVQEDVPSGTLGAVCKQVLGRSSRTLRNEQPLDFEAFSGSTIIAPSGDIVTNFSADLLEQMYDIHRRVGAALTMVLVPVPWERRADFGTVLLEDVEAGKGGISRSGRVADFLEKDPNSPSNLNNASIYMIEMDLIRELDSLRTEARLDLDCPFYDFGKHVFPAQLNQLPYISLSKHYPLWGVEYDGEWFDVGNKRDYLAVNRHLLDGRLDCGLPYERMEWGYLGSNVTMDFAQVTITPPVVIGRDCVIEPGARLGPYAVIGDDWRIERNACVRNSVLWERYPFFDADGQETSIDGRILIDRHEVQKGVTIEDCIVAGGTVDKDIRGKTVEVMTDGKLRLVPIDSVSDAARA